MRDKPISELIQEHLTDTIKQIRVLEFDFAAVPGTEADIDTHSVVIVNGTSTGESVATILVSHGLSDKNKRRAVERQLDNLRSYRDGTSSPAEILSLVEEVTLVPEERKATLSVSGVIIPETKVAEGLLVQSVSTIWYEVIRWLDKNWDKAHEIGAETWEEIVAGAFKKDGFDEVVVTQRSGDLGRDVIATMKGRGAIKIIGSVKAYKPGNLVRYDDVRALMGVLSSELNASKGIITTTSGFPPRISEDKFIAPLLPTRLQLMPGPELLAWLIELSKKR